jgi:hypothetical protein
MARDTFAWVRILEVGRENPGARFRLVSHEFDQVQLGRIRHAPTTTKNLYGHLIN